MSLLLLMSMFFLNLISSTYLADPANCLCEKYKVKSSGNVTINCTGIYEEDESNLYFALYKKNGDRNGCNSPSLLVQPNKTNHSDIGTVSLIYNQDTKSAYYTIHNIQENKSYCLSVKWSADNIKRDSCYIHVTVEDPDPNTSNIERAEPFDEQKEEKLSGAEPFDEKKENKSSDNQYLWFLTMLILVAVAIVAATFFIYKRKLKTIQRQVYELQQAIQVEDNESELSVMCQQPKPEASGHNESTTFTSTSET